MTKVVQRTIIYIFACLLMLVGCNSNKEKNIAVTNPPEAVKTSPTSIAEMENSLLKDSNNIGARLELAATLYTAGDMQKAAYHFTKVAEQDNKNLIAFVNLGNIYYD